MCQEQMHAQSAVSSKHTEHMHQELLHTLTYAQLKRKNSKF
jgi:hypothetical protein